MEDCPRLLSKLPEDRTAIREEDVVRGVPEVRREIVMAICGLCVVAVVALEGPLHPLVVALGVGSPGTSRKTR